MRTIPALAAALGCFLLASPAAAQQRDSAAGTVAEAPNLPTMATLLAATDSLPVHTQRLAALTDLTPERVRLVDVSAMVEAGNGAALDTALTRNAEAVQQMRAALDANSAVGSVLSDEITSANAVALHVGSDGLVWVYYRK